jgi:hypothetical protein
MLRRGEVVDDLHRRLFAARVQTEREVIGKAHVCFVRPALKSGVIKECKHPVTSQKAWNRQIGDVAVPLSEPISLKDVRGGAIHFTTVHVHLTVLHKPLGQLKSVDSGTSDKVAIVFVGKK